MKNITFLKLICFILWCSALASVAYVPGLAQSPDAEQEPLVTVDMGTSALSADEYFFTLFGKRHVRDEFPAMRIKMDGNGNILSQETSYECRFSAYKPVGQHLDAWIEQCEDEAPVVVYLGEEFGVLNRPPGWYIDGHDFYIDGAQNVYTIITNAHGEDEPYGFSVQKQSPLRELLFDWNSDDYMDPAEAYIPNFRAGDWAHVNSIDALWPYIIVSLRHTSSVVAIDERTGEIAWRLGGAKNDFTPIRGTHTNFACMHHTARFVTPNIISLYDNGNYCRDFSRGVVYELNMTNMTVKQIAQVQDGIYGGSGGGYQYHMNGSSIVAWGHTAPNHSNFATEFNSDGLVKLNASNPGFFNYQIYRRYHTNKKLYLPITF